MSKQLKRRVLPPAERLAQVLAQRDQYDHTQQEMADDVLAWLASISTLPIESRDIHVTLGGPAKAMEIVIDRIGTEVAEPLVTGSMMGMGLLVEPNLAVVGDMLFTATADRITDDPNHVSRLRMQIIRQGKALPRPLLAMAVQAPVEECPPEARDRPDALTIAYMAIGAKRVIDEPSFRTRMGGGEVEFIDMVIEHALLLDRMADDRDFNAVFAYDVAEPFGEWVARRLEGGDLLPEAEANAKAKELIDAAC